LTASTRSHLPSLRNRLARHVLLPLALVWLAGTAITVGVAHFYAQQAFDRSLLDDAYALAANVHDDNGKLSLKLTQSELGALLFDQSESVYFAVLRTDDSLVSGHSWLAGAQPAAPVDQVRGFDFGDIYHQGRSLRLVRLARDNGPGFVALVAQTTSSRNALLQRVLAYSFGPQVVLLVLLAAWLRRAIAADLRPLYALQKALDKRNANDLAAVPMQTTTRDVQRLGSAVNALMERIDAGVRAQREFAGNVAHELRTPPASVPWLNTAWRTRHPMSGDNSWPPSPPAKRAPATWSSSCWRWPSPTSHATPCGCSHCSWTSWYGASCSKPCGAPTRWVSTWGWPASTTPCRSWVTAP
jgi:two-component system sensor histidine kinase TctE